MLHLLLTCSVHTFVVLPDCDAGGLTGEDSLVRVSDDKLPGHALALSLQKVWEIIRDQKDLNLPAHKVCTLTICTPARMPSDEHACESGSSKSWHEVRPVAS